MRMRFVNIAPLPTLLALALCGSRPTFAAPPRQTRVRCSPPRRSVRVLGVSLGNGERVVATRPTMCGWTGPGGPANSKHVVASILSLYVQSREDAPEGSRNTRSWLGR